MLPPSHGKFQLEEGEGQKAGFLPRRAGTLLSPSFSSLTALTQTWPSNTAEATPALVWKEHFGGW